MWNPSHAMHSTDELYDACGEVRLLRDKDYIPEGMTDKQTEVYNKCRQHYIRDIFHQIERFEQRIADMKKSLLE